MMLAAVLRLALEGAALICAGPDSGSEWSAVPAEVRAQRHALGLASDRSRVHGRRDSAPACEDAAAGQPGEPTASQGDRGSRRSGGLEPGAGGQLATSAVVMAPSIAPARAAMDAPFETCMRVERSMGKPPDARGPPG